MWPGQVSNPGPLTYKSGALPTVLCGLAFFGALSVTCLERMVRSADSADLWDILIESTLFSSLCHFHQEKTPL